MLYWSRANNFVEFGVYLAQFALLSLLWGTGGWLLARHAFRLRVPERLISGLAVGMLLFISLSNLLANIFPVVIAFWISAFLIIGLGLWAARHSPLRTWIGREDLKAWPKLLILVAIIILFQFIQRSLALFDEYLHIPLVSTMAAGDIPPHFYLNPTAKFAYHYGLQVFAASLVRLGGFSPWAAWDLSRAIAVGFTLVLSWIWVFRLTRSQVAGILGGLLLIFGGGARWLLLVLPSSLLKWIGAEIQLANTGGDTASNLLTALHSPWIIEGGGRFPFPFAFHSGVFVPVIFVLGSTGAMPYMTVALLLILLSRRDFSFTALLAWSLVFSTLALSAEHYFAVIWVGILLAMGIMLLIRQRSQQPILWKTVSQWIFILGFTAILSIVQGGFVTETIRGLFTPALGIASENINTYGFSLRWPPAIPTAHLGALSILNIRQLSVLLMELGPVLLLFPLGIISLRKRYFRRSWFWVGLGLSAIISLLFVLFIEYGVDRSSTRFPATALWTWLLLGAPILWYTYWQSKRFTRLAISLGYLITVTGGIVIFAFQLMNLPFMQFTYFINRLDASFSRDYWNKLPVTAQILDSAPSRAVSIFGRISKAHASIYEPLPEWEALIAQPDPSRIAQAGYEYIYIDREWWEKLIPSQRELFNQPCVDILDDRTIPSIDFRLLIDVQACAGPP